MRATAFTPDPAFGAELSSVVVVVRVLEAVAP
jgi:hypothetical protein